jgi:hypothetical protein
VCLCGVHLLDSVFQRRPHLPYLVLITLSACFPQKSINVLAIGVVS